MEFEPAVSEGERPQTYALDRAATGTGTHIEYYETKITYVWRHHLEST